MRYPKDHREKSRATILDVAARRFREKGYRPSGVDDVMGAAGFTAAGFYAHFESKSALLAEALQPSLASGHDRLFSGLQGLDGVEWLRAVVDRYLSRSHRHETGMGCPLPALAGAFSREGVLPRRALEELRQGRGMPGPRPDSQESASCSREIARGRAPPSFRADSPSAPGG